MSNVSEIVRKDICSGCGVCAGVCPVSAIGMSFNSVGEYQPGISSACTECGICLKVCPFVDSNPNEDDIARQCFGDLKGILHEKHSGYYSGSFVGHSDKYRSISASGGLLTWLLVRLLESKQVDGVICVVPAAGKKLFEYKLCRTVPEIEAAAGSAYYPVEISEMLRLLKQTNGRYAVVCLPCVGKALRLACLRDKELQARIAFLFGLVCGQTKSRLFSEFCAAVSGGDIHQFTGIKFRVKAAGDLSKWGYDCTFRSEENKYKRNVQGWGKGCGLMWNNLAFTLRACLFCDDVFAETTDAAFMDAWLPVYSKDYLGTNIVLVRNSVITNVLQNGISDGGLVLEKLPLANVLESQMSQILNKRMLIKARAHWDKKTKAVPKKRSYLFSMPSIISTLKEKGRMNVQKRSAALWDNRSSLQEFIGSIANVERVKPGSDLLRDVLGVVVSRFNR